MAVIALIYAFILLFMVGCITVSGDISEQERNDMSGQDMAEEIWE